MQLVHTSILNVRSGAETVHALASRTQACDTQKYIFCKLIKINICDVNKSPTSSNVKVHATAHCAAQIQVRIKDLLSKAAAILIPATFGAVCQIVRNCAKLSRLD